MFEEMVLKGQSSVEAEEAIAKQIILSDAEQKEGLKKTLQESFGELANITDEIAEKLIESEERSLVVQCVQWAQEHLEKEGNVSNVDFSRQVSTRVCLSDSKQSIIYSYIEGEYSLILYQLIVEMMRGENISFLTKKNIIDRFVKFFVNESMASRALLSGDLSKAETLASPEMIADKEEIDYTLNQFFIGEQFVMNVRLPMDGLVESEKSPSKINEQIVPIKICLAGLNILLMRYGLDPLKPHRTDSTAINEAFEWAKEKAQEYRDTKKKELS